MTVPTQYISNYGHIGIAKEATFGTAVAATDFFPFESEGFETDPGVQPVPTIRGTRAENNLFFLGEIKSVGNLALPFFPTSAMRLLAAAIGSDFVTGSTPANPTTLSANAAAGSNTVTLTSATGYATGDYIMLTSATTPSITEVHKILSIATNTVTFQTDETLENAFASGDTANTVVAPFTHTMVPNEKGVPSLTVEKALASLEAMQYVGCLVNKASFTLATNAPVKAQYDLIGQVDSLIVPTTPTYIADTPYALANITATVFDIATPYVSAADFEIDNGVKQVYVFNGNRYPALNYSGSRKITGKLSTIMQSTTPYSDAMAGTDGQLVLTMSQSASLSATFTFSKIVYGKPSQPLKLGELIMQELPWTAYFIAGQTYDLQAVIVNGVWLPYV